MQECRPDPHQLVRKCWQDKLRDVLRKITKRTRAALSKMLLLSGFYQNRQTVVRQEEEDLQKREAPAVVPEKSGVPTEEVNPKTAAELRELEDAKELSALSGLAPRIIESGSSIHSSYLSRRSSGRLRQILYLDSVPGVTKIPGLPDFHQRLIGKDKKKMTARCACMRKMLLILRSMVVHNTPFNGKFPNNQRRGLDF